MITQCGGCGQKVWDNREKKRTDPKWANLADFTCAGTKAKGPDGKWDKGCGWKYNLPAANQGLPVAPAPQSVPSVNGFASYWQCFDEALRGIKERQLVDLVKGDGIVKIAATLFIQQSK